MLLPLLLAITPAPIPARPVDASIAVRLNHEKYEIGDHGKVYIETNRDGYVVILHADPEGRVRVLFPLDPTDDNFVRGDKKFEVRGRSDRDALQIDASGTGTVLAVFSLDPFTFDELMRNGHWDFAALGGPDANVRKDPLADLLEIANNMARQNAFDYDVATYIVNDDRYASNEDGYGYGHSHFGLGLAFGYGYPFGFGYAFGYPYYPPYYFVPFWGWYAGYYPGYRLPTFRPFASTPVVYTAGFAGGFTRKEPGVEARFGGDQARPRDAFVDPISPISINQRQPPTSTRSIQPRSRNVDPRNRGITPMRSRMSSAPSLSRGFFGGISRSFGGFRSGISGGFSGSRGGFSVGGRRH